MRYEAVDHTREPGIALRSDFDCGLVHEFFERDYFFTNNIFDLNRAAEALQHAYEKGVVTGKTERVGWVEHSTNKIQIAELEKKLTTEKEAAESYLKRQQELSDEVINLKTRLARVKSDYESLLEARYEEWKAKQPSLQESASDQVKEHVYFETVSDVLKYLAYHINEGAK